MDKMAGYRTIVVVVVQVLVGLLTLLGVTTTPEVQATIVENLNLVLGGAMTLSGIVFGVLRVVTDRPVWWKE